MVCCRYIRAYATTRGAISAVTIGLFYITYVKDHYYFLCCITDLLILSQTGFIERYGLYRTDFNDYSRTSKKSAWFYTDIIQQNGFVMPYGQCGYDSDRDKLTYANFPQGEVFSVSQKYTYVRVQIRYGKYAW